MKSFPNVPFILVLITFLLLSSCAKDTDTINADTKDAEASSAQVSSSPSTTDVADNGSTADALERGIAAQGGLDLWRSYASLSFDIPRQQDTVHHVVDLWSRKTLQTTRNYQLGFDGEDVWVAPNLEAYSGNARFANGLDFYFFAIPFVLADPGANSEELGLMRIDDKEYEAVKISYDAGVGDSPTDYYIVHFDPETYRLTHLLYTATYFSGEPTENYNARVYGDWQEVDGLSLPGKISSYHWDGETRRLGEKRGETLFTQIELHKSPLDTGIFQKPEEAEVAPPPQ